MDFRQDNNVCTILWLETFDSIQYLDTLDDDYDDDYMNEPSIRRTYTPMTFDKFKEDLKELSSMWDDEQLSKNNYDSGYCACIKRMAVVMAATSHLQITAEKHLKQLGFTQSGPFQKEKHSGSDLSIWIMPAKEFAEVIGYDN